MSLFNSQDEITTFKDYNDSVTNDVFINNSFSYSFIGWQCDSTNRLSIMCKESSSATPIFTVTNQNSATLQSEVRIYCPYKTYVTFTDDPFGTYECFLWVTGRPGVNYQTNIGTSTIKYMPPVINNINVSTGSSSLNLATSTSIDIGYIFGKSFTNKDGITYTTIEAPFLLFAFFTVLCLTVYLISKFFIKKK